MAMLEDEALDSDVGVPDPYLIAEADFRKAYGQSLDATLDLSTWIDGDDTEAALERMRTQVAQAVRGELRLRENGRRHVLPRLAERPGMGHFTMPVDEVERIQRGLLFNGGVEACDGTSMVHDTLPLTVAQVGVCLVAYHGAQNSWTRRMFRRDLRVEPPDPLEQVIEALAARERRSSTLDGRHDQMSDLARRGIMSYAERAVLRDKGRGGWYMGHGSALPWELLTGSGHMGLLAKSIETLRWLWQDHKRAVYIPTSVDRVLLTIGHHLGPLEYAFVETAEQRARAIVERGHYEHGARREVEQLVADVAPWIVVGVFRASLHAPAYAFYAHADWAHLAARIAIADAAMQEHRGFPTLIDLAHSLCQTHYAGGAFISALESAYADAGVPYAYLPERTTRRA